MPFLDRPDGASLHWSERGGGPLVVVANQYFTRPSVFEGLLSDLERDHRLVTYDVRGTGESSPHGPHDIETDSHDLVALLEHLGPPALVLAMADGCNRAVKAAALRPELFEAVVSPAGNPVPRRAAHGTDGLAGSQGVLDALMEMVRTDYRGAMRTMIATANPDLDDDQVRERVTAVVAHCPQHVAVARMGSWIADDSLEQARAVGDRLWILEHGTNPWFTIDIARVTRELLPAAHVIEVENGPVSRPDIAASYVRRLTGARAAVSASQRRD